MYGTAVTGKHTKHTKTGNNQKYFRRTRGQKTNSQTSGYFLPLGYKILPRYTRVKARLFASPWRTRPPKHDKVRCRDFQQPAVLPGAPKKLATKEPTPCANGVSFSLQKRRQAGSRAAPKAVPNSQLTRPSGFQRRQTTPNNGPQEPGRKR